MTADDELRARLRGMWAEIAPGWEEHAAYVDERSTALTERMLALAAPRSGDRVLELACGPGGLGLAAAPLVAPGGEVVLSDAVAEMTAIAARRASALGLGHVRTRVLDLEELDEPDAAYDAVLCREGLMFATDAGHATGEIARVLSPGGRAVVAVWGPRERNPWLGLLLDAVSGQLGVPIPPPGVPGPFSLGDGDALAALLVGAGLDDVAVEEVPVPVRAGSFDEWWTRTAALAGPVAKILASLPPDAVDGIRARSRETTAAYAGDGGLALPGVSLVAAGRRS